MVIQTGLRNKQRSLESVAKSEGETSEILALENLELCWPIRIV